eukprot:287304-Hanusia_phi.AAC.2
MARCNDGKQEKPMVGAKGTQVLNIHTSVTQISISRSHCFLRKTFASMVRLTSKHNPSFDDDDDEDDEFTPTCLRTTGSDSSDHPNNSSQHQARHRRFSSSIYTKKKQLDLIYGHLPQHRSHRIHALFAAVTGAIAVVHPQLYEIFMNLKAEEQGCRIMAEQANTIIRLYGALIFSQSWLVWKTREVPDPFVRKIFAQGYLLCFSTSTLVLGYAQLVATSFKRATKRLIVPCRSSFSSACDRDVFLLLCHLRMVSPHQEAAGVRALRGCYCLTSPSSSREANGRSSPSSPDAST